MSVYVTLFNYNKKKNSTAKPDIENGFTYECRIHSPCSLTSPEIILGFENKEAAPTYNYCYIDTFKRYYFIDDWTFSEGFWIASCSIDALASWWDELKQSTQYVIRSASEANGYLIDLLYPATTQVTLQTSKIDGFEYKKTLSEGRYVIGVMGEESNTMGAITYYAMTSAQFAELGKFLYDDSLFFPNIEDTLEKLKLQTTCNPMQYVSSAMWFPFDDISHVSVSSINFGWWTLPVKCSIAAPTITKTGSFALGTHPLTSERGIYLNANPYTKYTLFFPPFGEIQLDPNTLVGKTSLYFKLIVDIISGAGTLILYTDSSMNTVILQTQSKLGVNVAIGQVYQDLVGAYTNAVSGFSSALNMSAIGAAHGINNAVNSAMPKGNILNSNGSISSFLSDIKLVTEFIYVADDDNEHRGRPLCAPRILKDMTGYTLCSDVEIELESTDMERTKLKNIMEGGFYIE